MSLSRETRVAAELESWTVLSGSYNELKTCCLRFATLYGASLRMRLST